MAKEELNSKVKTVTILWDVLSKEVEVVKNCGHGGTFICKKGESRRKFRSGRVGAMTSRGYYRLLVSEGDGVDVEVVGEVEVKSRGGSFCVGCEERDDEGTEDQDSGKGVVEILDRQIISRNTAQSHLNLI